MARVIRKKRLINYIHQRVGKLWTVIRRPSENTETDEGAVDSCKDLHCKPFFSVCYALTELVSRQIPMSVCVVFIS